jgi:NodT family efflux transporter outer membrane factor (OMF) lipoprotein
MFTLNSFRTRSSGWLAACLLLTAVGCANREPPRTMRTQTPPPFSNSGTASMADRWWLAFDDPALSQQIDIALDDNFTLAAALQRLRASRALARREASDLFPDLDGVISTDTSAGPGGDGTSIVWGLDSSYQVDLWGRIQARADAERLRAAATQADYHVIALTLSAEVARAWFSLVEARAQLELLDAQIETNKNGTTAQELRFGLGLIRSADVFRQRQLLESTREQQVVVKARIEVLEHLLATLLGQVPQEATFDTGSEFPKLPPLPSTGLPSELLKRRPDVRREYLAFMAADRDLAVAVTDQYPRLNLTGSVLNVAERPDTLFQDWFVSIGSQLIAPLLDGGQRRAEVDRTAAVVAQRFNEYGETMLNAFREVEDNLARERYQKERIELLNSQVELARKASEQLREQYLIGDADYLDVLSAIQAQQRLQRETLSARLELVLIRIALYLSLAGDFEPRPRSVPLPAVDVPVELAPEFELDE